MTIEEILNRQLEDDDSSERFEVESLDKDKDEDKDENKDEDENEDEDEDEKTDDNDSEVKEIEEVESCGKKRKMIAPVDSTPSKYLTTGSKSALMTKCRTTLPTSYCSKRWSKIKS